ncbi:hypothetical protein [Streptosporangium sp. KLBMP 9127]|nr:hypothetical protein [Streptosporangium sp. KLBMP 9127]
MNGSVIAAALAFTSGVTWVATVAVPWPLAGSMVAGVLLATGVTNVLTTGAVLRPALVPLLRTRE